MDRNDLELEEWLDLGAVNDYYDSNRETARLSEVTSEMLKLMIAGQKNLLSSGRQRARANG